MISMPVNNKSLDLKFGYLRKVLTGHRALTAPKRPGSELIIHLPSGSTRWRGEGVRAP